MEPTKREVKILQSFVTYPLLTSVQVTKLHYSKGSYHSVSSILKRMVEKKLLARPERPTSNDPYFYMLGIRGVRILREMGYETVFRPSEHTYPSRVTMYHTMSVTDAMIAINSVSETNESFSIFDILHDITLKRRSKESVRADILTHMGTQDAHTVIFWEIDRGTEAQSKIRQKVKGIIDYIKYEYQNPYGTQKITWLFLTTRERRRFDNFLSWIETELEEMSEKNSKDMFRVATMPEELTAQNLFFEPIWRIPFEDGWFGLF